MRLRKSTEKTETDRQIAGWQLARHLTLGTIILSATLVLGLESAQRWNQSQAQQEARVGRIARVHSYAGIGVELERVGNEQYVRRVFPNTPAQGKIFPGAKLESVDGMRPGCSRAWAAMIRGSIGSKVDLKVSYDGRMHEVELERALIRIHY